MTCREREGNFWLDDVYCNGTEENLLQCGHAPVGVHDCINREAVHIRCKS